MASGTERVLPERVDVLIVGAGVAGMYCAWRLWQQDPSRSIAIVERLNRTGGRLDSDLIEIHGADGNATVRDEEGGMRFNYGMHELMALAGDLELCDQIVPFPMSPPGKQVDNNRYSLRGREFSVAEANASPGIWSELYDLAPSERGKSPVQIITEAYDKLVQANGEQPPASPTPEYWQRFRLEFAWKGVTLNEWQLWGLLRDMGHSEECVTMLVHTLGFEGPFLSLANAGEAFQILEDFPQDPTYFTFRDGFSTLPNSLRSQLEQAGIPIFLGANVNRIEGGDAGSDFVTELTLAPPGQSSSRFVPDGVRARVSTPRMILAVASHALTKFYASSPVMSQGAHAEQLASDIASVVNMRLLKINLYYDEAWWEDPAVVDPPVEYGPSFTDLPINSVYPFYSLAGPRDDRLPAALTIYCDFNNTNFWQGLQNVGPMFDSALQQRHSASPQTLFPASEAVVDEAARQFTKLYRPLREIPRPTLTSYRLWGGESDFGFAYHQWALNADDKAVMERLAQPLERLHVCNEAYSDMQGWVNGSLRSADRVLACFGLPPITEHSASACTSS